MARLQAHERANCWAGSQSSPDSSPISTSRITSPQADRAEFSAGLDFFTAVTKLLSADGVRKAVADSVPAAFRELNQKAFEKGFEYGNTTLAGTPP
jgi:Pyruvate/2-oxoacid:ferredoxin oxidoreductase gamma subunit